MSSGLFFKDTVPLLRVLIIPCLSATTTDKEKQITTQKRSEQIDIVLLVYEFYNN